MGHKQHTGFTLVELVVASALFAVIVALAVNLFVLALRTPIQEIDRHHLYEQETYVFEQVTYYIHHSTIDYSAYTAGITNPTTQLFLVANDSSGEKYRIYLSSSGQIKVDITSATNVTTTYPLTTSPTTDVYFEAVQFYVYPTVNPFDPANNNNQPAVVVYLRGHSVKRPTAIFSMQTLITLRRYER